MHKFQSIGAFVLSGAAVLALSACQPGASDMNAVGQMGFISPDQQDAICLQAVKDFTGTSDATILNSDHSGVYQEVFNGVAYDSIVTVGAGPDSEQWHCPVNNQGETGLIHRVSATHTPPA